jgi:hypothetical protein
LYVLVLTAAAGAGWRALGDLPRERAALVWVSLLPVLLALGASWVGQPIFLGKYALGSLAAVHALAAVGLAGVPGRGWAAALVALGFAESARDAHCARHRADWRALARFAAEASVRGEGPVVLSSPYSEHLAVYLPRAVAVPYLPPEGVASLARGAPAGLWVLDVHPARTPGALTAALRCCFQPGRSRVFYLARATHWERASAGAAPRL